MKRAIETGLGCPAPALPIHPTVYTLSSTINALPRGLVACPLQGPGTRPGPLWMPN